MPRILLIDDHAMVREGFRRLLEEADGFEVVAEAGTPSEALAADRAARQSNEQGTSQSASAIPASIRACESAPDAK